MWAVLNVTPSLGPLGPCFSPLLSLRPYAGIVTRETVWKAVAESLKKDFGRLLDVRDVRRVRRVTGDAWAVTVVLAASSGDIHVADLTVDEAGAISPTLGPDHFVEAIRRFERKVFSLAPPPPAELADFGDLGGDDDEAAFEMFADAEEPPSIRITAALEKGDPASLQTARSLLPKLLGDHDQRGATLFTMADVEVKLGEPNIARGYLEASAREFADRFDLPALEEAAAALAPRWAGPRRSPARPSTACSSRAARGSGRSSASSTDAAS